MIRCLLIQISRNKRGQPVQKDLLFTGETINIGRASDCEILLLDHRVNLHHAMIKRMEGRQYIVCDEGSVLYINGSAESSAELTPGTHVIIGPYELIAKTPKGDYDLVLSVEMIRSLPDDQEHIAAKQSPVTLTELGLSKRKPALWLAGAIALIFIFLPMIPTLGPTLPKWVTTLPVSLDGSWSPGKPSHGHRFFSAKCTICHVKPFEAVTNKTCESCHKTMSRHIDDKTLQEKLFSGFSCTKCHPDHGNEAVVEQVAECIVCHGNIKSKNKDTKLGNVHDFSTDHPAFSLTFKTGHKNKDVLRIPQIDKAKLVDNSGLKFSHKVHLDKEGVSSPEGDTVLECLDCHQPNEAGARFKPISMEKNCQQSGCHSLDFKPPVLGRQVPHGSERKLMIVLREYYATKAVSKMAAGEKLHCGDEVGVGKNQLDSALVCANNNASVNAEILFKQDSGCGECHKITHVDNDKDVPWKVTPVTITSHWLRNSRFSHAKHSTEKCTECHDKPLSEKSSDVAIPAIEKCRQCHVGNKQVKNKINSGCANCHSFHNTESVFH